MRTVASNAAADSSAYAGYLSNAIMQLAAGALAEPIAAGRVQFVGRLQAIPPRGVIAAQPMTASRARYRRETAPFVAASHSSALRKGKDGGGLNRSTHHPGNDVVDVGVGCVRTG